GLVDTRHGTGRYVSQPSSQQARDALVLLLEMEQVSLAALCDARILIEPELAYRAALNDDPAGREQLQHSFDELLAAPDGEHHVGLDLAFHGAIAALANHSVLRALVDAVKQPVVRGM